MEQRDLENINIEKNKELFAYEMTEVILKLKGEFAVISGENMPNLETAVDKRRLTVPAVTISECPVVSLKEVVPQTVKKPVPIAARPAYKIVGVKEVVPQTVKKPVPIAALPAYKVVGAKEVVPQTLKKPVPAVALPVYEAVRPDVTLPQLTEKKDIALPDIQKTAPGVSVQVNIPGVPAERQFTPRLLTVKRAGIKSVQFPEHEQPAIKQPAIEVKCRCMPDMDVNWPHDKIREVSWEKKTVSPPSFPALICIEQSILSAKPEENGIPSVAASIVDSAAQAIKAVANAIQIPVPLSVYRKPEQVAVKKPVVPFQAALFPSVYVGKDCFKIEAERIAVHLPNSPVPVRTYQSEPIETEAAAVALPEIQTKRWFFDAPKAYSSEYALPWIVELLQKYSMSEKWEKPFDPPAVQVRRTTVSVPASQTSAFAYSARPVQWFSRPAAVISPVTLALFFDVKPVQSKRISLNVHETNKSFQAGKPIFAPGRTNELRGVSIAVPSRPVSASLEVAASPHVRQCRIAFPEEKQIKPLEYNPDVRLMVKPTAVHVPDHPKAMRTIHPVTNEKISIHIPQMQNTRLLNHQHAQIDWHSPSISLHTMIKSEMNTDFHPVQQIDLQKLSSLSMIPHAAVHAWQPPEERLAVDMPLSALPNLPDLADLSNEISCLFALIQKEFT